MWLFFFFILLFVFLKKLNQRHICDETGFVKWWHFFIYCHYKFSYVFCRGFFRVNDLNFHLSILCTWILLWGVVKNWRKWRMLNIGVGKICICFGIPKLFWVIIIVYRLGKYLMICPFLRKCISLIKEFIFLSVAPS